MTIHIHIIIINNVGGIVGWIGLSLECQACLTYCLECLIIFRNAEEWDFLHLGIFLGWSSLRVEFHVV